MAVLRNKSLDPCQFCLPEIVQFGNVRWRWSMSPSKQSPNTLSAGAKAHDQHTTEFPILCIEKFATCLT